MLKNLAIFILLAGETVVTYLTCLLSNIFFLGLLTISSVQARPSHNVEHGAPAPAPAPAPASAPAPGLPSGGNAVHVAPRVGKCSFQHGCK